MNVNSKAKTWLAMILVTVTQTWMNVNKTTLAMAGPHVNISKEAGSSTRWGG